LKHFASRSIAAVAAALALATVAVVGAAIVRAIASNTVVVPTTAHPHSAERIDHSLGLPPLSLPSGVTMSAGQIALGRKLFFDRRLSINRTMSCAMCHVPEQAFASNDTQLSIGLHGRRLPRNAPSLLNVGWMTLLFHDGRSNSLIEQAWMPLLHPDEMGNPSVAAVLERIASFDDYRAGARAAYAITHLDATHVALALAAFQYSLVAAESRFDRWRYAGDVNALSEREQLGYRLFVGKAGCSACHTIGERSSLFTDMQFHVTGAGALRRRETSFRVSLAPGVSATLTDAELRPISEPTQIDYGRYSITKRDDDKFAFRTPSLRNVARSAPYMHDGSLRSLVEVVDFYDKGGGENFNKSPRLRPLHLTEIERLALVEFLGTLSGVLPPVNRE
jgi:cytochrome c peroxidase